MSTKRQELGLDFLEYRNMTDHVSVSELKSFIDSPFSYWNRYILGNRESKKSSAMTFGTLCHCLVLEPEKFDKEYLVSDVRRDERTKVYQEIVASSGGRSIITPAEFERANKVSESAKLAMSQEGFTDLVPEMSYFYEGRLFPTKVKARFDAYDPHFDAIVDLKTTNSLPSYDEVIRTMLNFRYHLQVAFYLDMHKAVTGHMPKAFYFVFALTEFPFASVVYKVGGDVVRAGRDEYRKAHRELAVALQNKKESDFPRIVKQRKVLTLPHWYKNRAKYEIKEIPKGDKDGLVLQSTK